MDPIELRDPEQARRFVLEGLWLQRGATPAAGTVRPALEWALEIAGSGQPLPPVGFVADLGHVLFGPGETNRKAYPETGLPAGLAREYEDLVLGRLYADRCFERAGDALRRYQGRDRGRGLAFVVNQLRERAGFGGALLSPAAIKSLIDVKPEDLLAQGWESLQRDGLLPLLPELYRDLVAASRRTAEPLGAEDVFELEHRTALLELGQRVALRQVLQAAARLEAGLPPHPPRPAAGPPEVPTAALDEDVYPVGGYASVSSRGTLESLIPSQLAYMEKNERPDLFDVKHVRDELLYYSRDETQFLRRRRACVFALFPDLAAARFKDPDLPFQRIVLLLGLAVAAVRKLTAWLAADALLFDFCFVGAQDPSALAHEHGLLELIFREQIANGTVRLTAAADLVSLVDHCQRLARRNQARCVLLGTAEPPAERIEGTSVARLWLAETGPELRLPVEEAGELDADGSLERWAAALERLLSAWV